MIALVGIAAACEPDLDGTAFKCDGSHDCPDDQSCISNRCRRVAPTSIECGSETCDSEQQCCADIINGNRCIGAAEVCPGDTALCDGKDDCAETERWVGDWLYCPNCGNPKISPIVLDSLSKIQRAHGFHG